MPLVVTGVIIPELSRYEIELTRDSIIGVGGMGVVLRAKDRLLNRDVAIKTINPAYVSPRGRKLFFREAMAHARLAIDNSERIVPVYNYGIEDGMPFMELELLHGGSLRDRFDEANSSSTARRGPLFDETIIKTICTEISKGLMILHAEKVFHKDLKPENILFVEPNKWNLKIADLGLAHIAESGVLTRAGIKTFAGGTEDYTPFDVHYGKQKADARTDIYSLGVILYEMLTREPLRWPDATKEYVTRRPDLSGSAKDLVIRSCRLMKKNNYNTVEQFLDGLTNATLIE